MTPVFVQASTLSFITSLLGGTPTVTSADATTLNSQTVPLLSAAINVDPHAAVGGGNITVVDGSALQPDEGPSGTAADIGNTQNQNSQISVYTVRPGDTLSGIAQMFDVSTNTIIGANDIKNGVIQPGETLIILPITGIEHTVVKGDTLASLAKAYNSDANDIASYNSLDDGAALTVGQTLIIPNGEATAVVSGSAPAKSTATKTATKTSSKTGTSHSTTIAKIASGSKTEPYLGGSGAPIPGYFAWPLAGGIVTQGLHGWNAVDIGAPKGTPIYAAADGTVLVAKDNGAWNGGYGNYVVIAHGNGTETLYAHMSAVLVSPGDSVGQGDQIGKVGMTGEATGNHLHFEVRGAENPFASLPLGSSD
ncbi:MAG TPA: peptidoglycan DD-metalloendopeptidase family protein [Candidatus Paceibacterota bacterium]|nr:peptidoglycan DD-metalloendopeptidase family protein [Candidatus Paceibacterota bacterium]